jgi:hypothetical protein
LSNCPSEQRHKITGDKRYVGSHDKQYETHTTRSVYIYRRYNSRNDDRRHRISAEREMISCFGWVMIAVVIVTSSGLSPGHDHRHTHTHAKLPRPVTKLRCSPHHNHRHVFTNEMGCEGRNRLQHRTQVDDVYNTKGVDSETNEKKKKKCQILWAMCRDQVARASSVSPNVRQSVCVCVYLFVCVCVCTFRWSVHIGIPISSQANSRCR